MPPVYLESFSFTLLCTIDYTHTILPNFHIVTGGGKNIAQNGQGPQLSGDMAGPPKPTFYREGILRSQYADDCHRIHFRHRRAVKASWSLFQHDGVAAFELSERSPLPPAVSAKDLPGGRTEILHVRRIRRINCHPVESDEDSAPESISDTEHCLKCNGELDHPNDSEDGLAAEGWICLRARQWHRGSGMPRAVECECCTKYFQIDSANTEVKETG